VAAHPGNVRTGFGRDTPLPVRLALRPRLRALTWWLLQGPADGGAVPGTCPVDPAARGDYYGSPGRAQFTGHPVRVESSARSNDTEARRRLWEESERLTGVTYRIAEPVR
jgi:hypothetical protein